MELEEMQRLWGEMSKDIEQQKIVTDKIILEMTTQKYKHKLNAISIPETIGAVICFAALIYLIFQFDKLDNWYSQLAGILSCVYLIVMPILSLRSIYKMKKINLVATPHKEALKQYAQNKQEFIQTQKIGFYFGFLFMCMVLIVFTKILSNRDLVDFITTRLIITTVLGFVFFFFFARWVFKKYKSATHSAERILKELEQETV